MLAVLSLILSAVAVVAVVYVGLKQIKLSEDLTAIEQERLDSEMRSYNLRHTFAYWSLRAGVPIATVAREMGHTSTEQTFRVYGGWCREMGADAAAMREAWAERESVDEERAQ
jgi:integrase